MLEAKLKLIKSRILFLFIRLLIPLVLGCLNLLNLMERMYNKSTFEHISQYLVQLGEAGSISELKVRLFSLSLTRAAFLWFSSLASNSINSWEQLEQKFHDHFFSENYELKLSHLTSVKQICDESVNDYIRRFHGIKNRCFNVNLAEKDLVDLALNGLRSHIKEKLEGYDFFAVNQVHQRALAVEKLK